MWDPKRPQMQYGGQPVGQQYGGPPGPQDPEEEMSEQARFTAMFDERSVRHVFVRKVYALVGIQLLIVVGCVLLFMFVPAVPLFCVQNYFILLGFLGGYLVLVVVIACVRCARQNFPLNLVLLFLCAFCISGLVGFVCAFSSTKAVLVAAASTTLIVVALTLFAFQTKWDFTGCGPYLVVGFIVLLVIGLVAIFLNIPTLHLVYSGLAVLFLSISLVVDTQLMLGGKHKFAISPEEHVLAALCLFTDIIGIFLHILNLYERSN